MAKKGFTLIELVVAITIVLLLSTVLVVILGNSKASSRDAQRINDVNALGLALTQYNGEYRNYPYWEITNNKQGIFNFDNSGRCSDVYPCIYSAGAGSSWRTFLDSFLTNKPVPPKKRGEGGDYYYVASTDNTTPPRHFVVATRLEGSNYTATITESDNWYASGYCLASECNIELPGNGEGWVYVFGN
ncbi:MAG TPA: prepilin-type N-terminal cleavage/methylation domain-containing protein [bacterium]|nr:prepilin-type N-terminal cleavage/methylation domain-containing protein [bacterium]HPL56274.1 prepilin-type N-terminal cleavage/methylation domain-containing protein [bacterium]